MFDYKAREDYQNFELDLKHKNRFFVDAKFVESLIKGVKLNDSILRKGTFYYRARIHKLEDQKENPFKSKEMFTQESKYATRGRANPDGISYLYLSQKKNTCIREVSPNYKDLLTIGEFVLKRDIRIINLVNSFPPSNDEYITSLNHSIRLTFSQLQLSDRPEIEYLPYQFICELIKNENYDGVLYNSSFNNPVLNVANNLVLFDSSLVSLDDSKCTLIQIKSTSYEYDGI